MPRRKHNGNGNGGLFGGFNLATVFQVLFIPALIVLGQWFIQGDEIKKHEEAITKTIPQQFHEEAAAREKSRNEFLDKLQKLYDGISALNTNVAVQTQALQQIKDQLAARR